MPGAGPEGFGLPAGFEPLGPPLGVGASAVVWRARRTVDGRIFALKVWREKFTDPEDRARFLDEVQRHAGLAARSGHLVSYVWAEVYADPPWIALEPHGRSLAAVLRDARPELREGLTWAADLLAGLSVLHQEKLLHRDVKPANVLVHEGRVKLCDFGLVVDAEADTDDNAAGTPRWTAPELSDGRARATFRSDVWSAGWVIREMLGPELPADIEQLLTAATSVRAHDRPATAEEFESEFRSAAVGAGIDLPPSRSGRRSADRTAVAWRSARRRRLIRWILTVIGVLVVGGLLRDVSASAPLEIVPGLTRDDVDVRPGGVLIPYGSPLPKVCDPESGRAKLLGSPKIVDHDRIIGTVEMFWSDQAGTGCARVLTFMGQPGQAKSTALTVCGSSGVCKRDAGNYRLYAGPVIVSSPEPCLSWWVSFADGGDTSTAVQIAGAEGDCGRRP